MKRHWTHKLLRPCSAPLIAGWSLLEEAVEASATQGRWHVVPLPTGSGKTEALIVLLSTPSVQEHPGALVVTRFKCEADRIAGEINTLSGKDIAIALHADAPATWDQVATRPVLVVTHAAYANALRDAQDRPEAAVRLSALCLYHQTRRKWTIIDEAFNWVDAHEVDLSDIAAMCGPLSAILPDEATDCLTPLSTLSQSIADSQRTDRADKLLTAEQAAMLRAVDFTKLRTHIRELTTDSAQIWRDTELRLRTADLQPTTFKKQYVQLVDRLQALQQIGQCWVSQRGRRTRLHGSRSLQSTSQAGGVILDATARVDRSYGLLGADFLLRDRPDGIRNYSNVTVYASRLHRVGKLHLMQHANTNWPQVARQLSKHLTMQSKVLVITHKDTAPIILRCGLKCKMLDVQHWGAIDGKNDWNDFDTVVVYGLPYLDDIAPTNALLTCTTSPPESWFDAGHHEGQPYAKVSIKTGFICRSVVQAINRARCRTVINDEGSCHATDVFILLPSGDTADAVLDAIQTEMPGTRLADWNAAPAASTRLTLNERRLLARLQDCESGTYSKKQMIAWLAITSRTFERISLRIRKDHSTLIREFAAIGVEYVCMVGRGREACFIKH